MPIIRKQLKPSDVYPDDIRYNDDTETVQRFIDGEWKDAPDSDPRTQSTLPPRITSDSRCDAAQSVVDALDNQISKVIEGIDGGMTALEIAGLLLGLFTFGVFAIFIELFLLLADAMLSAGSSALTDALTPEVYDDLKCFIYCEMDETGRINPGDLGVIIDKVNSEIGGLAGFVLSSMLALAGNGGVNNLGAKGTSTGDCSSCACSSAWCYFHDFTLNDGGYELEPVVGVDFGQYVAANGWNSTDATNVQSSITTAHRMVNIKREFTATIVTRIQIILEFTGGSYDNTGITAFNLNTNGTNRIIVTRAAMPNGTQIFEWTDPGVSISNVLISLRSSRDITAPYAYSGTARLIQVTYEGEGINPFGVDNCTPS